MKRLLIVDDDKKFTEELKKYFYDYEVEVAYSREEFEKIFAPYKFDVVLLDIRLDERRKDKSGLEILKEIKGQSKDLPVLIMTAYGDIDTAVESLKLGAEEFIQKDKVSYENYRILVENLLNTAKLKRKVEGLERRIEQIEPWQIIGNDKKIQEVREHIKMAAADGKITVLIYGETGTGKELVARNIHRQGVRKDGPFVPVSIAALNKETLTSELFGHEKGAFTGAISRRIGFIEEAHKGILFLDEIGDLPEEAQVKLLRVIETGEFTRMGSNKPIRVDFQLVSATHKNLTDLVKKGIFRQDLYYRIRGLIINLPPLRERKQDIPLLAEYFLEIFRKQGRTSIKKISEEAMKLLMEYDWPGNVRELRQVIELAIVRARDAKGDTLLPEHLPRDIMEVNTNFDVHFPVDIKRKLAEIELEYIRKALQLAGKKTEAWKLLGYSSRYAFHRRIKTILEKYPDLKRKLS